MAMASAGDGGDGDDGGQRRWGGINEGGGDGNDRGGEDRMLPNPNPNKGACISRDEGTLA